MYMYIKEGMDLSYKLHLSYHYREFIHVPPDTATDKERVRAMESQSHGESER